MKRITLICLLILFSATGFSQENYLGFSNEMFTANGSSLPYRLLKPNNSTKKQPLVIFLHGAGERGDDNIKQLNLGAASFLKGFSNDYSAYVVVPQCSTEDYWSSVTKSVLEGNGNPIIEFKEGEATTSMKTLMELINDWIVSGKIDTDRIYVGGLSMGGYGTYEVLWRMPNTFARAFSICATADPSKLELYASHTPLWIFHGAKDFFLPVKYARDTYTKLQQINNSSVKYSEYPYAAHEVWVNVFANKELIPWLFGYRNIEAGHYKIASLNSNNAITKSNTNVSMSNFTNLDTQNWYITKATHESYRLKVGDGTNSFLSVSGSNLELSSTANTKNQYWKLSQSKEGVYSIVSDTNGYALEMHGNELKLATKNTTNQNQKWKITHSKMYLIGNATPAKWDIAKANPMELEVAKDGVFTWSGYLWANNFKFYSTKSSKLEASFNAVSQNKFPTNGEKQKLVEFSSTPKGYDYLFNLKEAGFYDLTVDLPNKSMIVKKTTTAKDLYIIGSAIAGWNVNNPTKMTPIAGRSGVFSWEGLMNIGEFKFIMNKGYWNPSVNALTAQNVVSEKPFNLKVTNGSQGDYKFKITKEMYYKVIVDTGNWTMEATGSKMGIPLYIVGAATSIGWNNLNALPMTQLSDDVYTWNGYLEANEFKFITKLGTWNSIVPNRAKNENIINGYKHEISNNYLGDYKFNILDAGDYTITLNLTNNSMIVKKLPNNEPLYIVGTATSVDWDNTKGISMKEESEGIYSWSGYLKANEFKFITKLGTWNSIVPNRAKNENIINGYKHEISNNYLGDYKFNILDAGDYTITLNLTNNSMIVEKLPNNEPLYIVGAATSVGWNNLNALPMTQLSDDVYTWNGYLRANEFKFITKLGTWNSIVPNRAKNENIINGYKHEISNNYLGDYKFNILNAGDYTITLNLTNNSMIVKKLPNNEPLYIVGTATSAGWNNTKGISMKEESEGVYSWSGYLKAEQFKFITKLGTWSSIVPNRAKNENIINGYKHEISNNYLGDYRFNILNAGNYTITVDLNKKTMLVNTTMLVNNYKTQNTPLKNTPLSSVGAFSVVALQGSVMVRINSELKADRARLLDFTGNVLDVVKDKTKVFYLGNNVPAGIYIVEMIHNNQVFTKKVLIK